MKFGDYNMLNNKTIFLFLTSVILLCSFSLIQACPPTDPPACQKWDEDANGGAGDWVDDDDNDADCTGVDCLTGDCDSGDCELEASGTVCGDDGCEECDSSGGCTNDAPAGPAPSGYCEDDCDTGDCDGSGSCQEVEVVSSGVTGPSGDNYIDKVVSVSATTNYDLPSSGLCEIEWSGDADFTASTTTSSGTDHSIDAKLDSTGTPLKINAKTSEQSSEVDQSGDFTVVELVQFNADPTKLPICQGMGLSNDEFTIITGPVGYESQVVLNGLSSTTAGIFDATATLWGEPSPPSPAKTASYEILASGGGKSEISGLPLPAVSGNISGTSDWEERIVNISGTANDWVERAKVTWSGGKVWHENFQCTGVSPGSGCNATTSTAWGVGVVVGTAVEAGVPGFGAVSFSVEISGSWETSTTHSVPVTAPTTTGYEYEIHHYQHAYGISRVITKERRRQWDDPDDFVHYDTSSASTAVDCGLSTAYHTTVEKVCP
jgi:hypothetical protein